MHTYEDVVGTPTIGRGPETGFALDGNGLSAINATITQVSFYTNEYGRRVLSLQLIVHISVVQYVISYL